jgi:hypothetical protein
MCGRVECGFDSSKTHGSLGSLPNKGLVKTCEILFLVIPPRYRGKKKEGGGGRGFKK